MKIGLTGGIGAGKSYIADILRKKGYPVYDCDIRAKFLLNNSATLRKKIEYILGPESYKDNTLDRNFVAYRIFNNKDLLEKVNSVIHPEVMNDFLNWVDSLKDTHELFFMESAILFESDFDKQLDEVWCITASYETRLKRAMSRDKVSKELIDSRIAAQMTQEDKMQKCSHIIDNDIDSNPESSIDDLLKRFCY